MTQYELVEDPNDFFANLIRHAVHFNAKSQLWAAAFLLSHGILKLLIIAGLFLNKLWAYPVGIAVFTGLGFYQVYRYVQTGSPGLLILSALDVFIILLTWLEFRAIKRKGKLVDAGRAALTTGRRLKPTAPAYFAKPFPDYRPRPRLEWRVDQIARTIGPSSVSRPSRRTLSRASRRRAP